MSKGEIDFLDFVNLYSPFYSLSRNPRICCPSHPADQPGYPKSKSEVMPQLGVARPTRLYLYFASKTVIPAPVFTGINSSRSPEERKYRIPGQVRNDSQSKETYDAVPWV